MDIFRDCRETNACSVSAGWFAMAGVSFVLLHKSFTIQNLRVLLTVKNALGKTVHRKKNEKLVLSGNIFVVV